MADMVDIPHSRFINLVDPPASLTFDENGEASVVQLSPDTGGIIDVRGYRKMSLLVGQTQIPWFSVFFGAVVRAEGKAATLGALVNGPANDLKIHTFDIVAPEMALSFTGTPHTKEQVQLWVFLQS
jgi:hypothetical protein